MAVEKTPQIIDLSHRFTDNMPVYPGDPCSRLYQCAHLAKDGFNDHMVESAMHVGTHMDAPLHMLEDGAVIADFPATLFQGRGVLIDARDRRDIDADLLANKTLKPGDLVMVWTGWSRHYRTDQYFQEWPVFTADFCEALVANGVTLVGMDTPGPDGDERFIAHKILLAKQVLIVENVTNLEALADHPDFRIHAYPISYEADAAPVRIVAEIHD
ncbi:MAG: cyclase family protein [Pseudomonadota bacterium]